MRKLVFALICTVFAATGVFTVMTVIRSDRTPPVISVSSQMVCDPGLTDAELLAGVEASDETDGDVSGSLVIETFTVDSQTGTGIVVYAARDRSNNIGKFTRTLEAPEGFDKGNGFVTSEAESETEYESDALTYIVDKPETEKETETVPETDSETEAGIETETEAETESEEIQETNPGAPKLVLTQKAVTLKKGDTFNPIAYVSTIEDDYDNIYSLWRDIQVTGEYDTTKEGTYTLYYYVVDSVGNMSNREKFRVIVE